MPDEHTHQIGLVLKSLVDAAAEVDPTDLSGLARMHGFCQTLHEALVEAPAANLAELGPTTRQLAVQLEQLILGEAKSADDALNAIRKDVESIASSIGLPLETAQAGEPTQPESTRTPTPAAAKSANAVSTDEYVAEPLLLDPSEVEFVRGFVEEAGEHLGAIEAAILGVEQDPTCVEKINDLFRPFHTIKGMAGFLNLRDINRLAHEAETLLDQARKGQRLMSPSAIDLVLEVVDLLREQISGVAGFVARPSTDPIAQPPIAGLIARLQATIAGSEPSVTSTRSRNKPDEAAAPTVTPNAPPGNDSASANPGPRTTAAREPTPEVTAAKTATAHADTSIRIDTSKLDALVDMVGELVIAQTLVASSPHVAGQVRLNRDIGQVTKIVREVQQVAMGMRMIPIGATFQRMARLVRDVSRKIGKKVDLRISGEETELDKTVIEQIGDPLVHMVRNAIDHGIEMPAERSAAGKCETGQLHLRAFHQGGNIVIEIEDDGRGLDAARLLEKGREKGIVGPNEELSEAEIFQLIFAAGFSTAAVVTDLSGRGVGMDVVRRNIEQLRGSVDIQSQKGAGTKFTIRLPLTLAIIDGMVVRVAGERFIVPTIAIEQSLRPKPEQISTVQRRGQVLNVRGRLIPLVQLRTRFGLGEAIDPCEAMVVIACADGEPVGLVVEELIGQQQVVIKSLGERFRGLSGIVGGAILGDGRVGLILEISGLSPAGRSARHDNELAASGDRAAVPA